MTKIKGTRLNFILNEIQKISHKEKSGRVYVMCPYHDDSDPSFTINVDPSKKVPIGWGSCWACKASKPWNEHAPRLGMRKYSKKDSVFEVGYTVRKKMDVDLLGATDKSMTLEMLIEETECSLAEPVNQKWRGYSADFLAKFNCQIAMDKYENQVLLIPVYFEGEIIGGTVARWKKAKSKKYPSYLHMKGGWVKAKGLFPYDYVSNMLEENDLDYVVIVEGVRDALRLIAEGIPALCIFGTQTWTAAKLKNVLGLGVQTVFVGMDAGNAGVESANTILRSLKNKVTRVNIPMRKLQKWAVKKEEWSDEKEMDINNAPDIVMRKIKRIIEKSL